MFFLYIDFRSHFFVLRSFLRLSLGRRTETYASSRVKLVLSLLALCVTFYPVVHSSSNDEENDSCSECLLLKSMSFLVLPLPFSPSPSLALSLSPFFTFVP